MSVCSLTTYDLLRSDGFVKIRFFLPFAAPTLTTLPLKIVFPLCTESYYTIKKGLGWLGCESGREPVEE